MTFEFRAPLFCCLSSVCSKPHTCRLSRSLPCRSRVDAALACPSQDELQAKHSMKAPECRKHHLQTHLLTEGVAAAMNYYIKITVTHMLPCSFGALSNIISFVSLHDVEENLILRDSAKYVKARRQHMLLRFVAAMLCKNETPGFRYNTCSG